MICTRDASEIEFLQREISQLERVIKALHSSRAENKWALEHAEKLLVRSQDDSAILEHQQQQTQQALVELRSMHTAALAAAASHEAKVRMQTVELRLLCTELFNAELEREAAQEAELSALSIARSYRSFAAQGAARLAEMRDGVNCVQGRLYDRLDAFRRHARSCLRMRALRSVHGWCRMRDVGRCLSRWMLIVFSAEQHHAVALRLEQAYRHRDGRRIAERQKLQLEKREALKQGDFLRQQLSAEVDTMRAERDAALIVASEARAAEASAREAYSTLQHHFDEAQQRIDVLRRRGAADLAAARDELEASRRDTAAASVPVTAARKAQQAAEAALAECEAVLVERGAELKVARAEVIQARDLQADERRMRAFLERVLRDERTHAAQRVEDVAIMRASEKDHAELEHRLADLSVLITESISDLHALLTDKALSVQWNDRE